jgi:hypothetical protein
VDDRGAGRGSPMAENDFRPDWFAHVVVVVCRRRVAVGRGLVGP